MPFLLGRVSPTTQPCPEPRIARHRKRVRARTGQASHQSRPVQRGRILAPRGDHRRSPSTEAHELLDRLLPLKEQEARGSFRILRDWFPSGAGRVARQLKLEIDSIMMSLATLALGVAFFGLFFAMVAACDHL